MVFLIDYDNLGDLKNHKSLSEIIQIFFKRIPWPTEALREEVICRLYGGWIHKGNRRTQRAQRVSREVNVDFPLKIQIFNQRIRIEKPELATSLACDDQKNEFPNTFRTRLQPPPPNFRRFPMKKCAEPHNCPIHATCSFFSDEVCIHVGCSVSRQEAFNRPEQKLVDSMIVADLIYFATNYQKEHLVLVSGDDDMWPGIRYALLKKAQVIHIIPGQSRGRGNQFERFQTENYKSVIV